MHSHETRPLAGVIDIGSNSVRLVVYDRMKRVPRPLYNEKAPCGLGHGLHTSGRLDPAARDAARRSIARFVFIARTLEVGTLLAVATAAVRDAVDGREFIRELEEENDIRIRIISGEQEARLAAQGILASIHQPRGLAADFGGGSLELVEIGAEGIGKQHTLPIGSLRLLDMYDHDAAAIRAHVRKALTGVEWLEQGFPALYAIGGGFRGIARVHMQRFDYPLRLLHHYTMETDHLLPFFTHLLALSHKEKNKLKGLPEHRAEGFLPSLIVLEELIRAASVARVVISVAGIREGLLHDKLTGKERSRDALTASIDALTGDAFDPSYAEALFAWQQPLFVRETPEQARLRRAVCLLSEAALAVNPDFRAEWAFEHVLVAALYGITHRERVMLALALHHRYRGKRRLRTPVLELIDENDELWARLAGQAAGLAFELSAGTAALLSNFSLQVGREITLHGASEALRTLPEAAEKKLEGLGDTFKAFCKRFT